MKHNSHLPKVLRNAFREMHVVCLESRWAVIGSHATLRAGRRLFQFTLIAG
jgi:hypothetical protein